MPSQRFDSLAHKPSLEALLSAVVRMNQPLKSAELEIVYVQIMTWHSRYLYTLPPLPTFKECVINPEELEFADLGVVVDFHPQPVPLSVVLSVDSSPKKTTPTHTQEDIHDMFGAIPLLVLAGHIAASQDSASPEYPSRDILMTAMFQYFTQTGRIDALKTVLSALSDYPVKSTEPDHQADGQVNDVDVLTVPVVTPQWQAEIQLINRFLKRAYTHNDLRKLFRSQCVHQMGTILAIHAGLVLKETDRNHAMWIKWDDMRTTLTLAGSQLSSWLNINNHRMSRGHHLSANAISCMHKR